MNKLGFGFLRLPQKSCDIPNNYDWDTIDKMVDLFMAKGGRYFDTCYTYLNGYSEMAIRRCVAQRYTRERFMLADKLPGYQCQTYADCQRYLDEELERCGVEYFDVFMLHWLNQKNYDIAEKLDEFRFIQETKQAGKTKRIGFSYHDNAELLDEILTKHPEVDLVQLQINYLDWDSAGIESCKCYETSVKHGKKVIVMEPMKGGTLAHLPEDAESLLQEIHPDWSPADWALRFVQSLPEVEICLSGMNELSQVEANMQKAVPLTLKEVAHLWQVRDMIESQTAVPCTGCGYCATHCSKLIPIPECFKMLNELSRYPSEDWKIKPTYERTIRDRGKASDCVVCRRCEAYCPQHIKIASFMKTVVEQFE